MAINAKIDLKKPVLEEISAQVEGAQCVLLVRSRRSAIGTPCRSASRA